MAPYKSKAQAAFLHINNPGLAKKWDKKYGRESKKKLPQHVKQKKK